MNTDGFYVTLLSFFGELGAGGFAGRKGRPTFDVVTDPEEVIRNLTGPT